MPSRYTCQAPAVSWDDPEDREYWTALEDQDYRIDPDMIEREMNHLVHELWWRLPDVVRTVITYGLARVVLRASENALLPVFENREITIYLNEDVISRVWKAEVSGALVWGLGMALLEALSVQVHGEDSPTRAVTGDARGRQRSKQSDEAPSLTQMIRLHDKKGNAYISHMAEALAVAWGFEEEMTAFLSAPEIRSLTDRVEECDPDVIENMCMWAYAFFPRTKRMRS